MDYKVDRIAALEYPPEPEGRKCIADPHYLLALAILIDAIKLLERVEIVDPVSPWQHEWNDAKRDAYAWLTDTQNHDPFSLQWILLTLRTFGGMNWNAQAVAEAVTRGLGGSVVVNMSHMSGGTTMRVTQPKSRSGKRQGRPDAKVWHMRRTRSESGVTA